MKIVSWNVNGLRSTLGKGFVSALAPVDADVICLQEIKTDRSQMRGPVIPGYQEYWNSSTVKKGYSGTMVLTRQAPIKVENGIGVVEFDGEGRAIVVEFDEYFLINVYSPNAQSKLKRLDFRMRWEDTLRAKILELEEIKPVILCGDLNVAHKEIDLANATRNRGKAGFSHEERDQLTKLLDHGYLDAFRLFETEAGHYTFWRFNKGTRERNVGWRIDYFCVSEVLDDKIHHCYHLPEVTGSDHCPVVLELL